MAAIVRVDGLRKLYGSITAVNGISFQIEEGELFSLLGPNGAGKTTTISILSTLIRPTAGEAWIGDYSIRTQSDAVRRIIGIVPQEIALYENLSALENLRFWGHMLNLSGKTLSHRIEEVLEQIGLTDRARQRVQTFSGGMKRRLNIGIGLLHRPRLLFMDEPTVGIDPQSRRAILDTVKELNRQGMTILYTTHYMEEAQELAQRVGIIDHGNLIALGTQSELVRQIGQAETLILEFEEDQSFSTIAEKLSHIGGIQSIASQDHRMALTVADAEPVLPAILTMCSEAGLKIRGVQIQEPNLEAVFLHLTGRALRD